MDHIALWFASNGCALLSNVGAAHWNASLCYNESTVDFGYALIAVLGVPGFTLLGSILKFVFEG